MQAKARQAASESTDGKLKFTVVDPIMLGGAISTSGKSTEWVPIAPTTDSSFVMALVQWIITNKRYNADYISSPTFTAAKKKGFNSFTNASYLVITDPAHKNARRLLRPEDVGITPPPVKPDQKEASEAFIVIDKATGKPMNHGETDEAEVFFNGTVVDKNGTPLAVETVFSLLKTNVMHHTMKEYSLKCGVSVKKISSIAKELTSHGVKVGIDGLGNTASATGMNTAYAINILNGLIGNINKKGGMIQRRLVYPSRAKGPKYDLVTIEGQPKGGGVTLGRNSVYEKSTEYANKKKAGKSPYPSRLPWHAPLLAADNQAIFSIINGYPYSTKIIINWMNNPLFATPAAAHKKVVEALKNPDIVPLIISCDTFMGEMTALADYVIPDTTPYESWGLPDLEGNFAGKYTGLRWPVVEPLTTKLGEYRYACYENYLIDVAKMMKVPGYGDNAIVGSDKLTYPLNAPEDYFLKCAANTSFFGTPLPKLSDQEAQMQGLDKALMVWKNALKPDEWPHVAYMISRGGRFEPDGSGFEGDDHKYGHNGCFNIYSELLATTRNSMTGEFYQGLISSEPERFANGKLLTDVYPAKVWPFKGVSYKAKLRSNSTGVNSPILLSMSPENYIEINPKDAAKHNLKNGDRVRLISASGGTAEGILQVREGVSRGVIAVAFGYGHWEYGARKHQIGTSSLGFDAKRAKGVLLSGISLVDPSFEEPFGFSDMPTGAPARNGGAYRLEKI